MIYCIQTTTKDEDTVIKLLKNELKDEDFYYDIFYPLKEELVKYKGSWHKELKICFPSYIFIETDNISDIYNHFFNVPYLTKLLGIDKKRKEIVPLFKEEEEFINELLGRKTKENIDNIVELSSIEVLTDKTIKVISGPLKGFIGKVEKVDLHKRRVTVFVPILGQLVETSLGIDIVKTIDETDLNNNNE